MEFEGHLAVLTSSPLRDFEDSVRQPVVKDEDYGARLVNSRGLAFISCGTAEIALEQGL